MKSKKCSLRPFGQRSISSTFLFRPSNRKSVCEKNEEIDAPSQKGSHLSLSDFLSRKLQRALPLPSSVPGKEVPFSSPLSDGDLDKGAQVGSGKKGGGGGAESKCSIDGVLDMFKNIEQGRNDSMKSTAITDEDELQKLRKRKNMPQGQDDKPPARKRLVVLGEDSKSARRKNVTSEGPAPLFNHYENGSGWWDDNREGVDNEEVGCNNAWEGVGCTTLGGIEWH